MFERHGSRYAPGVSTSPRRVCVFCGSRAGVRPEYAAAARRLGHALVQRGFGLVYGGASVGLMGTVADEVIDRGGEAIGVIPEALMAREIAHDDLSELHVVDSMHQRKARMAELAGAFVALPGGLGTLEELFEVLTWAQLGLHAKPCGVLDVAGYYAPLASFLDRAVGEGFVSSTHRSLLRVERDPDALLDHFERYQAPPTARWIEPEES